MVSFQDVVNYQNKHRRSCEWMAQNIGFELTKYKRLKSGEQEARESDLKKIEAFLIKEKYSAGMVDRINTVKDGILSASASANKSLSTLIDQFKGLVNDDGIFSIPDAVNLLQVAHEEKGKVDYAFDELISTIEKSRG